MDAAVRELAEVAPALGIRELTPTRPTTTSGMGLGTSGRPPAPIRGDQR